MLLLFLYVWCNLAVLGLYFENQRGKQMGSILLLLTVGTPIAMLIGTICLLHYAIRGERVFND